MTIDLFKPEFMLADFGPASLGEIAGVLLCFLIFIVAPASGFSTLWHYLFSLPMLRRDRARFFLDLLETALDRGQSVEQALVSAAGSRDNVMGVRFFILAAHLEGGARFGEALQKVPRFLPLNITAILRTGEKLGDLKKVLPACRENLRNPSDVIRSLVQYMIALLLVFAPICALVIWLISDFVIPKFRDVAAGMSMPLWPFSNFVFAITPYIINFESLVVLTLLVMVAFYVGGPATARLFQFRGFPIVDWITWCIPWKRKRLQRTFSAMLAVLLDGGVPEAEAVRLAGDCTVNEICRHRAARIVAALEKGEKLEEAVRAFDDSGEFHWRLTNATHSHGGFLSALRGWHEVLDARATQQESTAAQAAASALIITNGLLVGLIATGMFGVLIAILHGVLDAS